MITRLRRAVGLTGAAVLAATGALAVTAPVAGASTTGTDPSPARAAAEWTLAHRDDDGLLPSFGEPSLSLTLDLGVALAPTGEFGEEIEQIDALLEERASAFTISGTKAAPVAKALAFTVDAGSDSEADGIDLQSALEAMVVEEGPNSGRIDDTLGGYASTWTQVWAVKGLLGHESTQAAAAIDYLVGQQCDAGWFRDSLFNGSPTDAQCADATPGLDTTALAVATLAPLADLDAELAELVDGATEWLIDQQRPDGGFEDPYLGANSNTTGLAGWALHAAGETKAATRAAVWLRTLQVGALCSAPLAGEVGAVAYNADALADGRVNGIGDHDRASWIFVGTQVVPGLIEAPAAPEALAIRGGTGFIKTGATTRLTVAGVAPGEQVCVTVDGQQSVELFGAGSVQFTATAGTALRTITARTSRGAVSTTVNVLDRATLKVKPAKKKVRKGKRNKITVTGLVNGERVTVKVRGKRVARGKANNKGVFKARFKVGTKVGKAKVKAVGQFANRKGAAKFRVR